VVRDDTLHVRLRDLHRCLRLRHPEVARVAIAVYDGETDALRTFVHSTDGEAPLLNYEVALSDVPSLRSLAALGEERVVPDLAVFRGSPARHTRRVLEEGYRSSYTLCLRENGQLQGFLFFDSRQPGYFSPAVVDELSAFARLAAALVAGTLLPARMLHSALRVATTLTHYRDPETGAHLERMRRYARLVAAALAPEWDLSDEFVEFLYLFAPLHDVGKIAVPDRILLKRERLEPEEFALMRSHVERGAEIVDGIVRELGLTAFPQVDVLRNVVLYHHEAVDGSGYPRGLVGDAIPIEARIATAADVYDALTSARPYKSAWSQDEALDYLVGHAGRQYDPACVLALRSQAGALEEIRMRFPDGNGDVQSREGYTPEL